MFLAIFLVIFFVFLLIGLPVAICLGFSSMIYIVLDPDLANMLLVKQMISGLDSYTLLAVPGFIFAGNIMNNNGMSDRLFSFSNSIVGHYPGGLGQVNILTSIIFAGMSGTALADAGGIGAIQIYGMRKRGYPDTFSVGITASSSIIGPIIPPSIPMLLYGVIASTSIGALFAAGIIPGLLMGISLSVMVFYEAKKNKYPREPKSNLKKLLTELNEAKFSLLAPVVIVGGMVLSIVTPTEAALIAIAYALFVGFFVYHTLTLKKLFKLASDSIETVIPIFLIIAAAAIFARILIIEKVPCLMAELMLPISNNPYIVLSVIMVIYLFAGTFMDIMAAMLVFLPIFLPIVDTLGVDRVHFGLLTVLALMIGLLTPPYGLVLFVLSKATNIPLEKVIYGTLPFIVPLFLVLALLIFFPSLVLYIPSLLFK